MAKDGRDDEIDALLDGNNIDVEKVTAQIKTKRGGGEPIKAEPLKTEEPIKAEPVKKDIKTEVPSPETIKADMLREMWGDQFKTVEDFKNANIPGQLQELATLRQKNQELETQVKAKPRHNFANDDIAKYNEFVRETGIKDAGIFNKLNATEVANMDAMDALVLQRIVDDPTLAGKEPQVRRSFERKFNVDHSKVDSGDLTQEEFDDNLMEVNSEGNKAKVRLQELKGKIKMPEIPTELPPEVKPKWTPEIEKAQKEGWTKVNEAIVKEYSSIPILMEGSKDPITNFALTEEAKKVLMDNALNFVVGNQMEVNEANVKNAATRMYADTILSNMGKIAHAIFERARSMTEEEYLKLYSNPSSKNNDQPPAQQKELSDEEKADRAFEAEMKR
jgi:hypothetical protein